MTHISAHRFFFGSAILGYESAPYKSPHHGIFPTGLYAPLFIGVSVGVTALDSRV